MDQLYKNHIIWRVYFNQKRQQLIKTQFRNLLKLTQGVGKYDKVLSTHIQTEISDFYRQNKNEKSIETIRKFLEANEKNIQILNQIINDFQTRTQNPSLITIDAIRNAYLQSGKAKADTIKAILKQNNHSLVTIRESSKENFVYNIPITQEMRRQILQNSIKYSSLYSKLFQPNYLDFIEPNRPLLYGSEINK